MNILRQALFRNALSSSRPNITLRSCGFSSSALDIDKLEKESLEVEVDNEEARLREEEIEKKRNKSRLYSQHQNIVNDRVPHLQPQIWQHETLKYKRRMYGIYGNQSKVNPSMCWPTDQEIAEKQVYEKTAFPYTIHQVREEVLQQRLEEQEVIQKRQEDIVSKVAKLDQWTQDLKNRIAKKEADAKAAKDRKDRLVEEVRRHFGYKIDPRDEKFKEMLEKKEKAEKKLMKEARRKAKEDKLIAKLKEGKPEDKPEAKENSEAEVKT